MKPRLDHRLAKLEDHRPRGCDTCRTWWGTVLRDDVNASLPVRCPGCGWFVPIRVALHIVGIPLDVLSPGYQHGSAS